MKLFRIRLQRLGNIEFAFLTSPNLSSLNAKFKARFRQSGHLQCWLFSNDSAVKREQIIFTLDRIYAGKHQE